MMEGATDTAEMVGAMRTSAQVLKNVQKQMFVFPKLVPFFDLTSLNRLQI